MAEPTPTGVLTQWLKAFEAATSSKQYGAAAALFDTECYWRDLISFSWNIKTAEGQEEIQHMMEATMPALSPSGWELDGEGSENEDAIEGWIRFETSIGRGYGHLRLIDGKCWTLLTTLKELKGHEEKRGETRERGVEHGASKHRKTWRELRDQEAAELGFTTQPYVVIIGGGQGGVALGARLRRLNVPTIIIEKNARPGDSWRKRYKSLCLHDPVWYDHLPYIPFPDNWPVFAPKDKIADWLESYTRIMELNYWNSTTAQSAHYDPQSKEWTVEVVRDGRSITLKPKQLVLATGMSGRPNIPKFKGAERFKGEQHHSSAHAGGDAYKGKTVVVIGSNNSSHDICAALWENDADVTMVQRSSTHIARSDTLMELALGDLYSERALKEGVTTEKADLIFASLPYKVLPEVQIPVYDKMAKVDAPFYERLKKAGFMLDFGADGSGLFLKYLRRGSGYYIDVGASDLIADGKIKLKSGVDVSEITEDSVVFTDGSSLRADVIVYATGYGSMNGWAAELISQDVADKVGKCWGLGSDTPKDPGPWEGELRNMWKPTQQEALWFHGGNLHQSRHYSQFLSLQLKARMEGIPTPVYGLAPVHHLT